MSDVPLNAPGLTPLSTPRAILPSADAVESRTVLVVEDHPLVAEATGKLLSGCGARITPVISSTAAEALERLSDTGVDWFRIFLDLDVPGAYGLSLAREVEARGMAARCCIVTAFDNPEYVSDIWSHGFLGYVSKASPVADFTSAILAVLAGERSFPFASTGKRVPGIRLTRRQTQLLEHIRAGRSSKEIAYELHIAEGTVNNHVAAILQTLEATSRAQAVSRAIELGFLDSRPIASVTVANNPAPHDRRL